MGVARKRGDNGIGISLNALISLGVVTLIVAMLFTAGNMMPTGKVAVSSPTANVVTADAPQAQVEPSPPAQNSQPSGFETAGYETASVCGSFGGDTILNSDVSSTTTCITITGSNLVFDCNGFTITYCTACGGSASGIFANFRNNVTIKNCKITTSGAGTDLAGIRLTGTNGSLISNTTITHLFSSGSKGISFESSAFYNRVVNSRINVTCTGSSPCYGIMAMWGPYNNITGTSIIVNTTVQNSVGIDANMVSPGFNISYTNVTVNANTINSCTGIILRAENQSISSTNVTINGNMYISALNLSQANNSGVSESSFNSFSSMSNRGIAADSSYNLRFNSINIKVNGTTDVQGLMLTSSGGTFRLINITQTGGYGTGMLIQNSAGTSFNSTILNNTLTWIMIYGSSQNNNFTNTTFMNASGSINILGSFNYSYLALDTSNLKLDHTRAFLNSTNLTFLNQTAIVYFAQTGITMPVPLVDWNDDGIYEQCPGNVCSVLNNTISSATINVSHFTSYSLAEANISTCPATIITSASLANNVSSSGTCITINASNVELDCRGYTITYDSGGGTNSYGVYAGSKTNVTVRNCIIFDPTTAGTNGFSVYFNGTNNSLVTNSTMAANGSSNNYPVYLYASSGNTVQNSILKPRSSGGEVGLVIEQSAYQNITNNAITTFNLGSSNIGVEITGSSRCAFVNNSVTTYGDSANHGIMLSSSSNITIENSTVTTSGTDGTKCIMLQSASRDNSITGSRITALTADSISEGIYISNSPHTILSYNNISTMPLSYGIELLFANFTSASNTWFNTSGQWINATLSYNNNFTNTTFVTASGSINLPYNFTVSGVQTDINRIKLNVTSNKARLNSSALPFMNTTGIITLYGISYAAPKPTVDFADTGSYSDCPADICTNLSYSGNTFVYNVTHFTSYSSAESGINICTTVTANAVLLQNIASNDTCITIGSDNIVFDCNGRSIKYGDSTHTNVYGVYVQNYDNVTIKNCNFSNMNPALGDNSAAIYFGNSQNSTALNNNITLNFASTASQNGIVLNGTPGSSYNTITGNRIIGSGTSNHITGLSVESGSGHNNFTGNYVSLNSTARNYAILLQSPSNIFTLNTLSSRGSDSNGVRFEAGATYNVFNATVFNNTYDWMHVAGGAQYNNYTNITFETSNGRINSFGPNTIDTVNANYLNITFNKAYMDSADHASAYNTSGIVTLYGISYVQPKPTVDYTDTGSYSDCPADTCTNLSYSGNKFAYNVSHFTSYSSAENFTAITGCPVTINGSTTLTQDIASNTTCILINANSVTLDCQGHTVSYGNDGSGFGIWTQYKRGLTIKDCVLVLTNTSASGTYAIYLIGSNHSIAQNNTMRINGLDANEGINLFKSWNDSLLNNRILVNSSGSSNLGIFVGTGAGNSTIEGNIIVTNGSTGSDGIVSYSPGGHRINYNNISTNGDMSFGVLMVFGAQNSSITGNRVETFGTSSYGIYLATDAANINVTSNIIYARGSSTHGIVLSGANGNNVSRNSISVGDEDQYGLQLIQSAGNTFNSNTINSTSSWAYIDDTSSINFTNTTFQSWQGSINLLNSTFAFGSEYDINYSTLSILANKAFIDTTNLTPLNTSGIITLYGISYIDPLPQVDWNDDGIYANCPANVCTKPGYSGTNLIFNVSHFTSFSSAENATQITGCPVTINDSSYLTTDIESNTSCIDISNDNINLDCNGHQIRYNAHGGNGDYGIYAEFRNNVTIENCIVWDIHESGSSTQGIQFNAVNSSLLNNDTIIVNGTNNNVGLRFNDVYYNIIENTTVITNCSGSTDHGIMLSMGTDNQFSYNTISAEGLAGSTAALLMQFGATNNTFINNVFKTGGASGSNAGIIMGYFANDNTFTGNTIKTYGASSNHGFYSLLSNLTHLSHNNFTTTGPGSYGLVFLYSYDSAADTTLLNTTAWMYSEETSYNYLGDTTFQMPDGSINIPGTLTLAGFNDVWYDNLNIQYNKAYLNSSNLSFMNTSGIITLYGITYASPQPSVDWNDDGVFEHCNYDVCTPISFASNDFVFSTAHFTTFAAAGDDVIINSTINQSNITNCTIINSTIINSTKSNCTIINSRIINSTNDNTTIIDSNETNSYDNDTIVFNSTIRDSIKDNSTIIGSNITNSTVNNSVLQNCTVTNSTLRFGIIDSNCNYINYNQTQPVPPVPPGGSQSGGGGGYGGGGGVRWKRNPNITAQFRNPICVENWNCEAWSRCDGNSQTRICVDLNNCSRQNFMPKTEQQCTPEISIQQLIEEPPAEPQIPMTMPDLRPEQEQPILQQASAALPILPVLLDVSLIILALLTIISMLLGSEKRSSPLLRILAGIMMAASLVMLVWNYAANSELLPMQTVVFIMLTVAVTLMWLYDYFSAESRKVPEVEFESTAPVLPDGIEHIEERPVAQKPAIPRQIIAPRMPEMRAEEPKPWVPRKIYVLQPVEEKPKERIVREKPARKPKPAPKPRVAPVREPEEPEGPMDLDSVLRRSKITLQKLDKTLKKFKKSSKKKKR